MLGASHNDALHIGNRIYAKLPKRGLQSAIILFGVLGLALLLEFAASCAWSPSAQSQVKATTNQVISEAAQKADTRTSRVQQEINILLREHKRLTRGWTGQLQNRTNKNEANTCAEFIQTTIWAPTEQQKGWNANHCVSQQKYKCRDT